ncbi:hypothetical protein IWQ62_004632 [Dispira parvispora]|uniref:Uncharacterized protein n=1 Tax=Dispira parvispora TaxID=1520584 RepID=A0A9W8ARH8_9FUNG|nr:hypothetical protein IWQ62_004632 [Dispira parvispora]
MEAALRSSVSDDANAPSPALKTAGIVLAVASGIFIGVAFVFKKKGILRTNETLDTNPGEGHQYLKSKLWWIGMTLLILGEVANFVAYALAPAILVTPLGAISVVVTAILSAIMLKERLNFYGKIGCALCLLGSVVIVLYAPQQNAVNEVDKFMHLVIAPGYIVWMVIVLLVCLLVVFKLGAMYGRRWIMVYLAVCGLVGSVSVAFMQGVGAAVVRTINGDSQLRHPFLYALLVLSIFTLLVQLHYLNKALNIYCAAEVTPVYYVLFTTATIVSSAILFQGFDAPVLSIVTVVLGFIVICFGVILIQFSKINDSVLREELDAVLERQGLLDNADHMYGDGTCREKEAHWMDYSQELRRSASDGRMGRPFTLRGRRTKSMYAEGMPHHTSNGAFAPNSRFRRYWPRSHLHSAVPVRGASLTRSASDPCISSRSTLNSPRHSWGGGLENPRHSALRPFNRRTARNSDLLASSRPSSQRPYSGSTLEQDGNIATHPVKRVSIRFQPQNRVNSNQEHDPRNAPAQRSSTFGTHRELAASGKAHRRQSRLGRLAINRQSRDLSDALSGSSPSTVRKSSLLWSPFSDDASAKSPGLSRSTTSVYYRSSLTHRILQDAIVPHRVSRRFSARMYPPTASTGVPSQNDESKENGFGDENQRRFSTPSMEIKRASTVLGVVSHRPGERVESGELYPLANTLDDWHEDEGVSLPTATPGLLASLSVRASRHSSFRSDRSSSRRTSLLSSPSRANSEAKQSPTTHQRTSLLRRLTTLRFSRASNAGMDRPAEFAGVMTMDERPATSTNTTQNLPVAARPPRKSSVSSESDGNVAETRSMLARHLASGQQPLPKGVESEKVENPSPVLSSQLPQLPTIPTTPIQNYEEIRAYSIPDMNAHYLHTSPENQTTQVERARLPGLSEVPAHVAVPVETSQLTYANPYNHEPYPTIPGRMDSLRLTSQHHSALPSEWGPQTETQIHVAPQSNPQSTWRDDVEAEELADYQQRVQQQKTKLASIHQRLQAEIERESASQGSNLHPSNMPQSDEQRGNLSAPFSTTPQATGRPLAPKYTPPQVTHWLRSYPHPTEQTDVSVDTVDSSAPAKPDEPATLLSPTHPVPPPKPTCFIAQSVASTPPDTSSRATYYQTTSHHPVQIQALQAAFNVSISDTMNETETDSNQGHILSPLAPAPRDLPGSRRPN